MNDEEKRTLRATALVLLAASLIRLAWESRSAPPILPEEPVSAELLAETRAAVEREERMATPLAPGERLDPNRAPDVELARLPGLGPALALRIVRDREANGPFRSPGDLLRVAGIGDATLARLEPHLDLSSPPPESAAVASRTSAPRAGPAPAPSPLRTELLDLNRASEADLETLPGIGPALAERIVSYRARVGRFGRVEDLEEVSGIGPATLERLRPLVRLGP